MAVCAGGHGQMVRLCQLVIAAAVHSLFQPAQQEGGDQRHGEVPGHLHHGGGEVQVAGAHRRPVGGEEIGEADDEHDGRILHIDDEVVADLGQDIPDGLRQDHMQHGLHMGHADGLGALGLAGVDGDNAAPDGLGHVGAGVDGHHQNGGHPDAVKPHGVVRKIGQAVIEEHRLQHHGGTPEDLHVDPDHCPDQRQKEPLDGRGVLAVGNGVQNAADESDQAADGGGHQCQNQGIADAGQIVGHAVVRPELGNVGCQLEQFLHGGRLPSVKS